MALETCHKRMEFCLFQTHMGSTLGVGLAELDWQNVILMLFFMLYCFGMERCVKMMAKWKHNNIASLRNYWACFPQMVQQKETQKQHDSWQGTV